MSASNLFRQEVLDHQRESMWGEVLITTPLSYTISTSIAAVVCCLAVVFLFSNEYSRKQVVIGYLTPNLGVVKVYPTQTGYFSEILVHENEEVFPGQVLATITRQQTHKNSGDIFLAQLQENTRQEDSVLQQITATDNIAKLEKEKIQESIKRMSKEISLFNEQIVLLKTRLSLSHKNYQRAKKLNEIKVISQNDFEQSFDNHLKQKEQLQQFEIERLNKQRQLSDFKIELSQLDEITHDKHLKFENKLSVLRTHRLKLDSNQSIQLTAPISGKITGVQAKSGETAKESFPLLSIIPVGQKFLAHLYVPTRAVGTLEAGQPVRFKFDAFPYQKYGIYRGTVEEITQTIFRIDEVDIPVAISEPSYRVTVSLDKQFVEAYGKQFSLQAGMTLSAEIIYDRRDLVEWLLEPLYSLQG